MQNVSIWAIQICNIHIMKKKGRSMMTTNTSYTRHGLPNYHGQKGWKLMECIVSNATFATPLKGSPNACTVNGTIFKA
jgi:hypothetical protein